MREGTFCLRPFPSDGPLPELEITGSIFRSSKSFKIRFDLHGSINEIIVPPASAKISRKNGLWERTCLEFFLREKGTAEYWEFNISPSGHWNVYRFESYRKGMQEEYSIMSLPSCIIQSPEALQVELDFDLNKIIPSYNPLQVAVSAVIQHISGITTYWALDHTGPQADFHLPECFTIEL